MGRIRERGAARSRLPVGLVLGVALLAAGCRPAAVAPSEETPTRPIAEVLAAHTPELMAIPGVVGTGEGRLEERPAVLVLVTRETAELRRRIPRTLEGYPVVIQPTGTVRPLDR